MVNRRTGVFPSKLDGVHATSTTLATLDESPTDVIDGAYGSSEKNTYCDGHSRILVGAKSKNKTDMQDVN